MMGAVLAMILMGPPLAADGPAVSVQLDRPDELLRRVLDCFGGTGFSGPAEVLAAWRKTPAGAAGLGKPMEAGIAALNPFMVAELRILDGTEIAIESPAPLAWWAAVPRDDGSFAATAPALGLTDGAAETPLNGAAVDRLGPPGSALIARRGRTLALANSRAGLGSGLKRAQALAATDIDRHRSPGLRLVLNPDRLAAASSIEARQVAEALRGLGCRSLEAVATIEGDRLLVNVRSARTGAAPPGRIDPSWLAAIPANASAAFAFAWDGSPGAWNARFAAADRVEKADPANAKLAPIRVRLNLLASAAGIRPEVDLWPKLLGISGFATSEGSRWTGGAMGLHLIDEASAGRVLERVLPTIARALQLSPIGPDGDSTRLGEFAGRPLVAFRRHRAVWIAWGPEARLGMVKASDLPDGGAILGALLGDRPASRFLVAWPGRIVPSGFGPLWKDALSAASPIVWRGFEEPDRAEDDVVWSSLKPAVGRFVLGLPLDPQLRTGK